jgi:hypothetical protein
MPSEITQYAYEDLTTSTTADQSLLLFNLLLDDRSDTTTAIVESKTDYNAPDGAQYEPSFGPLEEAQHSLGNDGSLSLKFDISGRVDTELVNTRGEVVGTDVFSN